MLYVDIVSKLIKNVNTFFMNLMTGFLNFGWKSTFLEITQSKLVFKDLGTENFWGVKEFFSDMLKNSQPVLNGRCI